MSFSSDLATLLGDQMLRLVTLNPHQLAGQAVNLDFWMEQVRNALQVIDDYPTRFERMKAAQVRHAAEHHTIEFHASDPCCTADSPMPPRRVPDAELREARRLLCDAAYRFLVRCCSEGLIAEDTLFEECRKLDISVARSDLMRSR